jgi:hypothetical protein
MTTFRNEMLGLFLTASRAHAKSGYLAALAP